MKPLRRWLLLGSSAALLGVIGTLVFLGRPHDATTAPQGASLTLRWRVGSSQLYRVLAESSARINAAGAGAPATMQVRMEGMLEFQTLETGPAGALVGMRLSSVDVQFAGKSDPDTSSGLALPFRVRFSLEGTPTAFEFPAAAAALQRGMLENLVRMFQVTIRPGQKWLARESNASGSFEAAYSRTAPSQVEKTKLRPVGSTPATVVAYSEVASKETIRLDPTRDWIAAMTIDETLRSKGRVGPDMEVTTKAALTLQAGVPVPNAAGLEAWRFAAAAAPADTKASQATGLSFEDAKRQLGADIAALDATREGRRTWIRRMSDLVRSDDALPAVVLDALRKQTLSDRTRADLYFVFELAGTPQAQRALASVFTDPAWSQRDALRAIVALAGVSSPTADSVAALWRTAAGGPADTGRTELAATATLALGSLGNALDAAKDPGYASLRAGLLGGALAGSDLPRRASFVQAIGNTHDASLAGEIVPLLDDAAPAVRRAAAQSLGMLGTDQVADELMLRFKQERSSAVRGAIAESLVSWTSPTPAAVARMRAEVRDEVDENTRFHMARLLGNSLSNYPENRVVLQDLLRSEPSKRIRLQVAEALNSGR